MKKIGMDIGSTTLKTVVLDETGKLIYTDYKRHFAQIFYKVKEALNLVAQYLPNETFEMCLSGSAAMGIAEKLQLPFIQEVYAQELAAARLFPEVDTIIELGGEDAKILFLKGNKEVRMNDSCAGGTGAFIDQMVDLLGVSMVEFQQLAEKGEPIYPIASRCGVFAKSDIQPLLNQGVSKADIAASILTAVAHQTIIGLAKGRKISGQVLYLGGPLSFMPALRRAFDTSLAIKGMVPAHSLFYVAIGAAYKGGHPVQLKELIHQLTESSYQAAFENEPPLFENEKAYLSFKQRHHLTGPRLLKTDYHEGPYYLGIDAGSTTIKAVLIDASKKVLMEEYGLHTGNALEWVKAFLIKAFTTYEGLQIAASVVTGYGEALVQKAFDLDEGVVETAAHYEAACFYRPDVDFVIDIGGQDMKCFKIESGHITDIFLNEACSSGCGSFLQNFAASLGYDMQSFARLGLFAKHPAALGSRCTVFMNSAVKQAQKEGASIEDLSAGLAISVVKNALYKVLRVTDPKALGRHIVVQGGTFFNDNVLRAFEREMQVEVIRPHDAGLMGAYGAALLALKKGNTARKRLTLEAIEAFTDTRYTQRCQGCTTHCLLTIHTFSDGQKFIGGNHCSRMSGHELRKADNLYAFKRQLLRQYEKQPLGLKGPVIGIPRVFHMYEFLPFWLTLLTQLGFRVKVSPFSNKALYHKGQHLIPSDTVCYPAKLVHGHIVALLEEKVDLIFYPCMPHNVREGHKQRLYNCPVAGFYPEVIRQEQADSSRIPFVTDIIELDNPKRAERMIYKVLQSYLGKLDRREVYQAVRQGYKAYEIYKEKIALKGQQYLETAQKLHRKVVVLAGRPYHVDPEICHGIDNLISQMGFTVLSEDALSAYQKNPRLEVLDQWTYASRLYKAAQYVAQDKDCSLYLVQLISFGCGIDGVTADEVKSLLQKAHKPYMPIKIDETDHLGAATIRLRSLLEVWGG